MKKILLIATLFISVCASAQYPVYGNWGRNMQADANRFYWLRSTDSLFRVSKVLGWKFFTSISVTPDSAETITSIGSDWVSVLDATTGKFKKITAADLGVGGGGGSSGFGIDSTVIGGTTGAVPYIGTNSFLQESATQFVYDSTNIRFGVGIAAPARTFEASINDAVTNAVSYPLRLSHTTSGTATTSFSTGIEINQENASGTNRIAGTLEFPYTDAVNATEDASFNVNLIRAGALQNALNINSIGNATFAGSVSTTTVTATGNITVGAVFNLIFNGRALMASPSSGNLTVYNSAGTDFTQFNFGGNTSSFAGIRRNGALLDFRLGDNSDYTDINIKGRAYNESTWNGSNRSVSEDAVRDLVETSMPQVLWRDFTITTSTGTSEVDLYTYTTPANTLSADGQFLEYEISGVLDPTSNNGGISKTLRFYWAGTEIHEQVSTLTNFALYTAKMRVVRVSSSNVRVFITLVHGAVGSGTAQTVLNMSNDFATTFSGTNIIKITGQSANASEQMDVRYGVLRKTPN